MFGCFPLKLVSKISCICLNHRPRKTVLALNLFGRPRALNPGIWNRFQFNRCVLTWRFWLIQLGHIRRTSLLRSFNWPIRGNLAISQSLRGHYQHFIIRLQKLVPNQNRIFIRLNSLRLIKVRLFSHPYIIKSNKIGHRHSRHFCSLRFGKLRKSSIPQSNLHFLLKKHQTLLCQIDRLRIPPQLTIQSRHIQFSLSYTLQSISCFVMIPFN